MIGALNKVALACGSRPGRGCHCAYCGASPFDAEKLLRDVSEAVRSVRVFPGDTICLGCADLLSGKPGRVPPPLRMRNVLVVGDKISHPKTTELREVGRVATDYLLEEYSGSTGQGDVCGMSVGRFFTKVVPIYHPAYLLRKHDEELTKSVVDHLRFALELTIVPF